ncbi:MAG TPA: nucleotidyltransferase domain-containing protein [Chthonomonadaceae bacterium]|nr:nucleotidyltransferase domain-containing protein [Chthonomonadaceae bacterium]
MLSRYTPRLSVLLVGSVATGLADEGSDVDVCFVAPPSIWHELDADLVRGGFKSGHLPNEMTVGTLRVDWFVVSLSGAEAALEAGEDYALYDINHFIALQDPGGQYQRLAARYQSLDPALIAARVQRYSLQVTAGAEYLGALVQRGDPLECATQALGLAICAISLCLWLDGHAPGSKRMMEMAEQCSTAECLMPPVRALLQALGEFLAGTVAAPAAGCQLMRAAGILVASCERARAAHGSRPPGSDAEVQ